MGHSNDYDPYQDLSPPFDPDAHTRKDDQYGMMQQETELLDPSSREDLPKSPQGPRHGLTTTTDAADFQPIRWPDGPRFLRTSVLFDTMIFVLEGILVLMALAFLCLAILACRWNNMPSDSDLAHSMEQAMKLVRGWELRSRKSVGLTIYRQGPTIYPLLFAALVGRALKGIGRFRAERGSRISVSTREPQCLHSHAGLTMSPDSLATDEQQDYV